MSAELSITNTPVSGGQVDVSLSGFSPDTEVQVFVEETLTGCFVPTDDSGNGTGSFLDPDPPGSYTLIAMDNYYLASRPFTLGGSSSSSGLTNIMNSMLPMLMMVVMLAMVMPLMKGLGGGQ